MNTYPNQKIVKVIGDKHDKEHLYATIGIDNLIAAMQQLNANAFKLWCYMAKNQNNYCFALSSKDACACCGFAATAYNNAIKELIQVGYLVWSNNNNYDFYEKIPKAQEINIVVHKG